MPFIKTPPPINNYIETRSPADSKVKPVQIIYREIDYDVTGDCTCYSVSTKRVPFNRLKRKWSGIEDFVLNIKDFYGQNFSQEDLKEENVLGIPLRYDSYIVLLISKNRKWTFSPEFAGVTMGNYDNAAYNEYYENLVHFDGNDFSPDPIKNCRLIYFSAKPRMPQDIPGKDNIQKFNFNFFDGAQNGTSVDPDIRYPGNGGQYEADDPQPISFNVS